MFVDDLVACSENATRFCRECNKSYCDKHFEVVHDTVDHEESSFMTVTEMQQEQAMKKTQVPVEKAQCICSSCVSKTAKVFCLTCCTPLCNSCSTTISLHKKHKLVNMQVMTSFMKEELDESTKIVEQRAKKFNEKAKELSAKKAANEDVRLI